MSLNLTKETYSETVFYDYVNIVFFYVINLTQAEKTVLVQKENPTADIANISSILNCVSTFSEQCLAKLCYTE